MPPAVGLIIRETMRPLRISTVRSAPRLTSPSMMMQPMKPAPICTTRVPGLIAASSARASASVQQLCTPGRSMPGIASFDGRDPVATSSRSNGSTVPSCSRSVRARVSSAAAAEPAMRMRRRS